jgi:hypothetical protein
MRVERLDDGRMDLVEISHRLDDHFAVFIPDARAIHPVTGGDWEGCGVQPDVICPADGALELATRLAREALSR